VIIKIGIEKCASPTSVRYKNLDSYVKEKHT
jgi:hypothetical protein